MANQIINEEFRRMQKLAGLLKEEDSNQSVTLYSSWLSNNEENKKFFPRAVLYPGDNNLTKANAPGTVDGKRKKGIECMAEVFQVVATPENGQNKETSLFSLVNPPNIINKTQDKRISDEWLNAQIDKYYPKEKDDPEARKRRFDDLKSDYEFWIEQEKKWRKKKRGSSGDMYYGCYVKDIKPNEIIAVKEFYQEKAPESF